MNNDQTTTRERVEQKRRTREQLLAAARGLLAQGETVTVTAAARSAGISKATAYRYFSDPALLTAEAGISAQMAPYEEIVAGTPDLPSRLLALTLYFLDFTAAHEAAFRQYLARMLEASLANRDLRRGGRRADMLRRALDEDDSVPEPTRGRLVLALSATTGIEALIALVDVAGADHAAARATVRSNAAALIAHHLGTPPP